MELFAREYCGTINVHGLRLGYVMQPALAFQARGVHLAHEVGYNLVLSKAPRDSDKVRFEGHAGSWCPLSFDWHA